MAEFVVRQVKLDDANRYNAYRRRIADEPDNMVGFSAGEYIRTIEEERQRITDAFENPNHIILVAEAQQDIIGSSMCKGGLRMVNRHMVGLGIDVAPEYRGKGVGNALMIGLIEWAQVHQHIRRIELDVFKHNRRAIGLYLKHGFVIEGMKSGAYFKYGNYVDTYLMALILPEKS